MKKMLIALVVLLSAHESLALPPGTSLTICRQVCMSLFPPLLVSGSDADPFRHCKTRANPLWPLCTNLCAEMSHLTTTSCQAAVDVLCTLKRGAYAACIKTDDETIKKCVEKWYGKLCAVLPAQ